MLIALSLMLSLQSASGASAELHTPHRAVGEAVAMSPFPAPEASDTRFVVDKGAGLDTDCTFRNQPALIVHLPVTRYVGETNANGTLRDAKGLVSLNLVSQYAHLRLPVYDVDVNGDPSNPSTPPEVDHVIFNGQTIEPALTGDNNIWKPNDLQVPIEFVRFASRGSNGGPPTPGDNVIQISIDEKSGNAANWCTALDWVELSVRAVPPIVLVHGVDSSASEAWSPEVVNYLNKFGPPYLLANLERYGSIAANGHQLAGEIAGFLTNVGARSCHIIAHSKGGLDAVAALGDPALSGIRVLTLNTLSTPFGGSILADIALAARQSLEPSSADSNLHDVIAGTYFGAKPPALDDLTVAARGGSPPVLPQDTALFAYAGSASATRSLTVGEASPYFWPIAQVMYNIVGTVADIDVSPASPTDPTVLHNFPGVTVLTRIDPIRYANDGFEYNDVVVTVASALPAASGMVVRANHGSIIFLPSIEAIVDRIVSTTAVSTP